jgi:hypothetical protein
MGAKQVLISSDDVTYSLLPGGTGELTRDGAAIVDTIFGQDYKSEITGPIAWAMNANAIYKGYPGYTCSIKKPGTSTAFTSEATTLVSGKTYQITDTTKRVWDRATAPTVYDNAVDHTSDVESIDFLFGRVTFKAAYTVTGPITVDGHYFPLQSLGKYTSYTLTQTAEAIKDSDMPTLQGNGGFDTNSPGLKTVTVETPAVFNAADDWQTALETRGEYVIEINPDGTGESGSLARGFFRLMSDRQSGNVGALEEETLTFSLNVPYLSNPGLDKPFGWQHAVGSPIPTAIKTALDAWEAGTEVYGKYLHDGTNGWKGQGVVTNLTLTGGMDTPNTFAVSLSGDGALSAA